MERVGVFYATREGQSRKVAGQVAAALVARGLEVAAHDARDHDAERRSC
jgi:flavodoxin